MLLHSCKLSWQKGSKEFQKLVTFGEPRLTHNGQIGRALDRDGISFGFGGDSKLLRIQPILKGRPSRCGVGGNAIQLGGAYTKYMGNKLPLH